MFKDYIDFHDAVTCYEYLSARKKDQPEELLKLKANFRMYAKMRAQKDDSAAKEWVECDEAGIPYRIVDDDLFDIAESPMRFFAPGKAGKKGEEINFLSQADLSAMLKPLHDMVGLSSMKKQVSDLIAYARIISMRRKKNLIAPPISMHMAFLGQPGCGKTTVARLIAGIYYRMGLIRENKFIEVSRADLIGAKIGQTEEKTKEAFMAARGGVLFIDEAHTIIENYCQLDFGHECAGILTKMMEDYREDTIVIFAGYEREMKETILAHKGIKSRVHTNIVFDEYKPEDGILIFKKFCKDHDYVPTPAAMDKLSAYLEGINKDGLGFYANGRDIRNIFEKSILKQAQRLSAFKNPAKTLLKSILPEDIVLPETTQKNKIVYLKN